MKITSLFVAGAAMLIFNSCSSDNDSTTEVLEPPTSFNHFTVTSTATAPDGSPTANSYTYTENLMDQKRYSVTQDGTTTQRYFYVNGLLSQSLLGFSFGYDASGKIDEIVRLIGEADEVPLELKYRFVHPQQNVMYCERMVWATEPPEILYRNILEFDADGNVIKAGPDLDLDGIMDHYNQLTYANGDLTNVQVWNGTSAQFSYSDVKDNFCLLDDNTYGKKVRRAMCSEYYAGANFETNLGHSAHVLADETPAPDYVLLSNGFYQKKTTLTIFDDNSQNETVVEFFLD
ncbi:MAG TPA: hypothetical protein VK528_05315 [Flavobacterium sp.]|nr:hypothetical protein [Flavobacterium sp.]